MIWLINGKIWPNLYYDSHSSSVRLYVRELLLQSWPINFAEKMHQGVLLSIFSHLEGHDLEDQGNPNEHKYSV